jgi:NADPH:quinone reductase-like Zn-dependent oxidoreductase
VTRAAYITRLGPPSQIRWGELPDAPAGPADVIVRTEAVAVDPVDTLVRSGRYSTPTPSPFVIGRDLVGEVVRMGPGFTAGQRVWCNSMGHGGRQGAFAERVVVPADRLYPLPAGVGAVEAVAVLHPAATAYLASVDVHVDTSGHHDLETAVGLLAHGGRIVLPAGTGARPELPVGPLYVKDGRLLGFAISNASTADLSRAAATINRMLEDGSLPARIAGVLPLREAAEAHRRLEGGQVRGRLVLRP